MPRQECLCHNARSAVAFAGQEEFFEEETGKEGGVVANDAVLFKEIIGDHADTELEEFVAVEVDGFGVFGAITAGDVGGNGLGVGDDHIDEAAANMLLDSAKMIAEGITRRFARLGHKVSDVHAGGFGTNDGASNFGDQEIRNDAGVQGARAHEDKVGIFDGFDGPGKRAYAAGVKCQRSNRKLAARDARFPVDAGTVGKGGDEVNVRKRGRKDAAANG